MERCKIVFQETGIVALGVLIGVAVMLAVFALMGLWEREALWGSVMGGVLAVLNFFVMAVCASLSADRVERQNVRGGKALLRVSYIARMAVLGLVLFACAKSGMFHAVALVLPLSFPRIALTFGEIFRGKGG